MSEEAHVQAVREFLQAEFADYTIEDHFDGKVMAYNFRIIGEGKTYLMAVKQEFFKRVEPWEIALRLSKFFLVEHLRDLPDTLVMVTSSGLKLEYE